MSPSTPGRRHAPQPEDYCLTTPLISSPATLRNQVLVSALHTCSIQHGPDLGKTAAAPRYVLVSAQSRRCPRGAGAGVQTPQPGGSKNRPSPLPSTGTSQPSSLSEKPGTSIYLSSSLLFPPSPCLMPPVPK